MKNNLRMLRFNFQINCNITIFYNMQLCINFEELLHGGSLFPELQTDISFLNISTQKIIYFSISLHSGPQHMTKSASKVFKASILQFYKSVILIFFISPVDITVLSKNEEKRNITIASFFSLFTLSNQSLNSNPLIRGV